MPRPPKKRSVASVVADTVIIAHTVVGVVIYFLGENTKLLVKMYHEHSGMMFIQNYLDYPVVFLLKRTWVPFLGHIFKWVGEVHDTTFNVLSTLFVIVASSVVYGLTVYVLLRLFVLAFDIEE